MEPIFENRFVSDFKTMAEFSRKYRVGPRPAVFIACIAIYILMIIFSLVMGIWEEMLRIVILVGVLYTVTAVLPYLHAMLTLNGVKKQNDGVMPETVVTFGDTIQIFEGMVHLTIEYHKVIRVVRLKHSYCLMTSKSTAVLLREDAFTKGTFEGFKQFLREKYPQMKIPE